MEEARAAQSSPAPSLSPRRETVLNGSPSTPRSPAFTSRQHAPRIVPQADAQTHYAPPLPIQLALVPIKLVTKLLWGLCALLAHVLSIIQSLSPGSLSRRSIPHVSSGRKPLSPRDTAARFAREFEEEYGSHNLPLYEVGYAQAYDLAKKELKFLLVILLSPEHDETSTFVQKTLLSQELQNFIADRATDLVLWAGNVQDSEAYQVSAALNCIKHPFAALIVHTPQDSPTAMTTVARVHGLVAPTAFVAQLKRAMDQQMPSLSRVRAQRSEQQAARNILEEQNSAYERSLAQDRERARQHREAEAARVRAAEEERSKAEAERQKAQQAEQWRQWRAQRISPEPSSDVKDATRISLRMLSGERVVRKFQQDAELEEFYAFAECYDIMKS